MKRSLSIFYVANASLVGFTAIMLYPAFWQVLYLSAIGAALTYTLLAPVNRKTFLCWLVGLGGAAALVAAVFGTNGDKLSAAGSVIGFILMLTALGAAWRLYRAEAASEG
ncbi:hypothetical protein KPL74_13440 [Bacillus sp. NP157]|nr:hypothetical protein KPL74_13440 [Bacillus sp. NP157]